MSRQRVRGDKTSWQRQLARGTPIAHCPPPLASIRHGPWMSDHIAYNDQINAKMGENILQEISNDNFEDIISSLSLDVPVSLPIINLLKSYKREDTSKETELKVYCPEGDPCSRVVILTLTYLNECGYKFIKIFSSEDKILTLQEALDRCGWFNWNNCIIEGLHKKFMPTVQDVFKNKSISLLSKDEYICMFLPMESYDLFNLDLVLPEDLIIRPLTSKDAALVDQTWAYHSETTYDYVHHSIVFYGGLGLVQKSTGQLVSWAVAVFNTIGMVHTLPAFRHKGYAGVAITAIVKKHITADVQPVCLIKTENIPSQKLFRKLGFQDAGVFYCADL